MFTPLRDDRTSALRHIGSTGFACSAAGDTDDVGEVMNRGPSVSDEDLLPRVRNGDIDAFECLYVRHAPRVRRYALSLTRRPDDADELVAEVFANLLSALQRGKGPTDLVVPYVISCVKHEHWRSARRRVRESTEDGDRHHLTFEAAADRRDIATDIAEADVISKALLTLPARSRELLWMAEVEETPPQDLAARDGMTPHAVAVSAHRARRAFGSAYLAAHVAPVGGVAHLDPACRDTLAYLAPFVRGRVGVRRRRRIERHLSACAGCADDRDRIQRINGRLRHRPHLPFEIGVGASMFGFKAQLGAWLGASTVPLASAGAMALAVVVPMVQLVSEHGTPAPAVVAADASSLAVEPAVSLDNGSVVAVPIAPAPTGPWAVDDAAFAGPALEDDVVSSRGESAVGPSIYVLPPAVNAPVAVAASALDGSPATTDPGGAEARSSDSGPDDASGDAAAEAGAVQTGNDAADVNDTTTGNAIDTAMSNGQSKGNAIRHAHRVGAHAQPYGPGNGPGNVNGNGPGNGNANGNGNGDVNGVENADGQANGNGGGQRTGNGNGNGNGDYQPTGNGNGNRNGQPTGNGIAKATATATASPPATGSPTATGTPTARFTTTPMETTTTIRRTRPRVRTPLKRSRGCSMGRARTASRRSRRPTSVRRKTTGRVSRAHRWPTSPSDTSISGERFIGRAEAASSSVTARGRRPRRSWRSNCREERL